ncbi:MAG: DnaJ domain-containing protein [Agriterribacter sp.]
MQSFKNYYKTLGLPANASATDIKKKFRRLAMQYHPDINQGNALAEAQFRELQEAYEVLSDPTKRSVYLQEWKMHFPGVDISQTLSHTPESILSDSEKLHHYVGAMDAFRMNKENIYQRVKNVLSDHNITLLLHVNDQSINKKIIQQLLLASSRLRYKQAETIAGLLKQLTVDNNTAKEIEDFIKNVKKKQDWERYYPLLVMLLTVIICVLIYVASR